MSSEAETLSLNIDGKNVTFDDSTGYPYLDGQGRAMMPLRVCLDSIGCNVQWDEYSQSVIIRKWRTEVVVPIGKFQIQINQETVPIDTAAVLHNGRTYLPLRAVFEAYQYHVGWDNDTKTVNVTSAYTPRNINGGTTGVFVRKQLDFIGFDVIQADIMLPKVRLGQKGDCPYVYFGFDFPNGEGNTEGGFQFIEDEQNPGYNKWTVYLRQGNGWYWGENILLDQESYHNIRFYADKVSDTRTDLVIDLDGKEIIRKASTVNNFELSSVKYVDAIAMSIPFDGTNCPSASLDAGCYNLMVSEYGKDEYSEIENFDVYREYKNGFWYGTIDCIPDYVHYNDFGPVSLYRTSKTGGSITLPSDAILSGEVLNTFSAGGELRHELSAAELREFVRFFNACDIKEGEREWTTVNSHDHLSDSIDLVLRLEPGDNKYISAYYDGDILISDESGDYYYLHNPGLQDYIINTMGKYLNL
jgi:hypothetical protein